MKITKTKSIFFAPSGAFGDDTVKAANDLDISVIRDDTIRLDGQG
ncbi:MAG: hypothetical protein ACLU7U_03450 [Romboutsia timonensis]